MRFEIPIFPLNVVLFPGMPLPLHIFEPRYRLMMHRVIEVDGVFGVALLAEGIEGLSGTLPASVGCTAEIIEHTILPDGRLNIQGEGRRRFRILELREEDDYLIGSVEWLDDQEPPESDDELQDAANAVRRALRRYLVVIAPGSKSAVNELEMPDDAQELSHWVAMLISAPNFQKQDLLELTSTAVRLEAELHLLQRAQVVQSAFNRRAQLTQSDEGGEPSDTSFVWLN